MRPWGALASALLTGLVLSACAALPVELPPGPVPFGPAIAVDAKPIVLDPADPTRVRFGRFILAGAVHLTSGQTSRLHGLSDMKVTADGRLLAASDQSDLLRARIVLDRQGRFIGLADARLSALKDEAGADLFAGGQRIFDSEGIAELANGDILVSYEQTDRVLLFPRDGGPTRRAPQPDIRYEFNKGMEAMVAEPAAGPDAYRVGLEGSGEMFACRLSTTCQPAGKLELNGMSLVSIDLMADGRMAYLLRDYSPLTGNRTRLRIIDAQGVLIDELRIEAPLTTENFEGLAAVPTGGGGYRFYLVSDDNFGSYAGRPTDQRTLMLAFDWKP